MRHPFLRGSRVNLAAVGLIAVAVTAGPLQLTPAAGAPGRSGAVTIIKTVTRQHLDADGHAQKAERKTVSVTVDHTTQLKGRQDINVSWKGAHPTGGVQPDLNGTAAGLQEYPMMLVECRGVDSTRVASAKRVSQKTCWTHGSDVRYRGSSARFISWRLDRYASAANRAQYVNRPSSLPVSCGSQPASEYWQPFFALDGKRYDYGNQSCAGLPPEDYNFDSSAQSVPQNVTFAPTATDGTGTVKFDVWTEAENASLGCSARVACTLEVIPIMGVSCDPAGRSPAAKGIRSTDIPNPDQIDAATQRCEASGTYAPGDYANGSQGVDLAVSGALWWAESNWRNRISVPLNFAPVSNACEQVGGGDQVSVYGSELMTEATTQWGPAFCLDPKLFKFTHVQTAEPLARTLINDPLSGVDAAFSSSTSATGFARPTVQAPVAVSGFAVSFNVDNTSRKAVTTLRLTPRLLAKLLTESYPGDDFDRFKPGQYPYLKGNPYNVTKDPEFQALNPNINAGFDVAGASALIVPSAETDVTQALTAYIDADPEARAWLDGTPDPWGMVVNPAYKKIALPLLRWPLLDTTVPTFTSDNQCSTEDPAPWLPLLASPTPALAATAIDVQFAASPGRTICTQTGDPNDPSNHYFQWSSAGRAQPGQRIVMGVTSLAQASRYDLNTSSLQTTSSVGAQSKFTSANGRTFVTPTSGSLAKAAGHLKRDDTNRLWTVPAAALRQDSGAYPGLMVINADVPTRGVKPARANDLANLLRFAAGRGQTPGTGNGDLPGGYLPMTADNGLGALAAYTLRAGSAVQAQRGSVPALVAPRTGAVTRPTIPLTRGSGSGPGGAGLGSGGGGSNNGDVGGVNGSNGGGTVSSGGTTAPGTPSGAPASKPGTTAPVSPSATAVAQTVATPSVGLGFGGVVLPLLLGAVLLGGLVAGGAVYGPQLRRKR